MPTRVLLLRHAETSNPHVFHGFESDVGLGDRGRLQAEAVAAYLAGLAPQAVVSSGMRRALDTAGPIARACGLTLGIEPDLHERRVGALSGTPAGGSDGPWPDTLRRWMAGDTGYATPGAESFDDIRDRVLPAWERLAREDRTVVVVAHGIVIRVLLLSLLPGYGVSAWKRLGPIRNVAIHELVREAAWRAVRLNEMPPGLGEGGDSIP
jgi:2,3-bisphosphoglycerate-dependent phosphoglycerate mutase